MTLESLKKKDNDELYLSDLFKIVFNHFILIAVIAIVFAIVGFAIAVNQPERYTISVSLRIKNPPENSILNKYGYDYYTSDAISKLILSNRNIQIAFDSMDKSSQDLLYSNKVVDNISLKNESLYYELIASNVENAPLYTDFLHALIESANEIVTNTSINGYNLCRTYITEALGREKSTVNPDSLTQENKIKTYEQELERLEIYKKQIEEPISILDVFQTTVEGKSPIMTTLIAFVLGGFIGVIIAFAIDLTDKRIYSTTQLARTLDIDDIITSIPLYKDMAINENDTQYIANKIRDKGNNILVTSVSDRSGKTSIAGGLKRALKEERFVIEDGNTFSKDVDMLKKIKEADINLVVLKAGFDKLPNMIKVLRDMLTVEAKNIYVILNGVDYSDKNINHYEDKSAYKRHIWIVETWRHFYKKNSFR